MLLNTALQETCRVRWRGRPTELELYARAGHVAALLKKMGPTANLVDVTTCSLTEVQRQLLEAGKAPATVNHYMSAFATVLRHARDSGQVVPTMPPPLREGGRDPRALDEKEWDDIWSALPLGLLKRLAMFLLHTGLRVGEALAARWEDVDLDGGWIEVVREKSGRLSRVPLTAAILQILRRAQPEAWCSGSRPYPEPALFPCSYHTFLQHWRQAVTKALGRYGPELGPHVLRRTFATRLSRKGASLAVIQRLLGHRSIRTTQRYIAVTDQDLKEAIR